VETDFSGSGSRGCMAPAVPVLLLRGLGVAAGLGSGWTGGLRKDNERIRCIYFFPVATHGIFASIRKEVMRSDAA
jgi:hypothetical protein